MKGENSGDYWFINENAGKISCNLAAFSGLLKDHSREQLESADGS